MKHIFKKFVSVLTATVLLVGMFALKANAAQSTVIRFSSSKIDIGKKVTVSVKFNAPETMYSLAATLSYDSSVLQFVSGDNVNGSGGSAKIVLTCNGKTASTTMTFKAISAGKGNISVVNCEYVGTDEKTKKIVGASASVSVIDKSAQSGNAYLKSLAVSTGKLSPSFAKTIRNYRVDVKNSVKELAVNAIADDSNSKVKISGSDKLKVGNNQRIITVTAQNGSVFKYTVNVYRAADDSASSKNESSSKGQTSADSTASKNEQTLSGRTVTIDGSTFKIDDKIEKATKPSGFEPVEYSLEDKKIPAYKAKNCNYFIFHATEVGNSSNSISCLFDEGKNSVSKLNLEKISGKKYVIIDSSGSADILGFEQKLYSVHDKDVYAYKISTDNNDEFIYFYCINKNGDLNFYRYDTVEDTIQRSSDSVVGGADKVLSENKTDSGNANRIFGVDIVKVLFAVSGVLLITSILLIVLLAVKNKKNR